MTTVPTWNLDAGDQFLNQLAHDLNAPMTYLVGYAEMLALGQVAPADVPDVALEIYREACRMADLVGVVVESARARGGRMRLAVSAVRFADLVERALTRWRLARPDVRVEADYPADLVVRVDRDRFLLALHAMLSLAAGVPREDRVPLRVCVRVVSDELQWSLDVTADRVSTIAGRADELLAREAIAAIAAAHGGSFGPSSAGLRLTLANAPAASFVGTAPTADPAGAEVGGDR